MPDEIKMHDQEHKRFAAWAEKYVDRLVSRRDPRVLTYSEYIKKEGRTSDAIGRLKHTISGAANNHNNQRLRAGQELAKFGFVEPLIKASRNGWEYIRRDAVFALGDFGPKLEFNESWHHSIETERELAIRRLKHMAGKEKSPMVLCAVAESLGRLCAVSALPELLELARKDKRADVLCSLADALGKLERAEAVPELFALLASPNPGVSQSAQSAIEMIAVSMEEKSLLAFQLELNKTMAEGQSPIRQLKIECIEKALGEINSALLRKKAGFSSPNLPEIPKGLVEETRGRGRRAFQNHGRVPAISGRKPTALVKIHG